ncbi:secreted RxLR effector protein 161-like [Neodiprion virginianus]|uniref:secreted RxLR effector protein 161-like n=1 Tax=Neodiprion fabricii TaxID=2872261 RepID=UPI001ED95A78|nr:secreted RxLR effector protein 161-like [Neodiprion fabricii]XP_046615345.1 secreted RxLR effector protein 161-like [Neodiprion virginianus]
MKTPLETSLKLEQIENSPEVPNFPYSEGVGSVLYLGQTSRPDICYASSYLSSFNKNPKRIHVESLKHLLRYLHATKKVGLVIKNDKSDSIIGYCDADWANDVRDRKSITGYIFFYNGSAISWSTSKQKTVATSTCQAEYQALSAACSEAIWIKQLINEFDPEVAAKPVQMKVDNRSAIDLSMTASYKKNAKHIDVKHHFIREQVEDKIVEIQHVNSEDMVADYLTKSLELPKHQFCVINSGLEGEILG